MSATHTGGNLRKTLGVKEKPLRFALRQLLQKKPRKLPSRGECGCLVHRDPGAKVRGRAGCLQLWEGAQSSVGIPVSGPCGSAAGWNPRARHPYFSRRTLPLRAFLWTVETARIRVGVPSLIVFLRGQSCLGQCHLMNGRLRSHPHWGESSEVWGRLSEPRSRGSPVCTLWQTSVKVERIKDFPENPAW